MSHPFVHRALTRRNPWIAFLLSQLCPGWGQIYNRDWKWVGVSFVLCIVATAYCTVYLFDTFEKITKAVGIALALGLVLSVQAFIRARKHPALERAPYEFYWRHIVYRVVCVYFGFAFLLYGIPDGYGVIMPTRLKSFQIPSESMVPNLLIGDRLVADGWSYWGKEPMRGDVVVFDYPKEPEKKFVKRLVGLPGDVIEFKRGELFLNGKIVPQIRAPMPSMEAQNRNAREYVETLDDPGHIIHRLQPGWNEDLGPITVPPGKYFMCGDNRDRSSDSRFWGFVNRSQLIGKMSYVYFSWDGIAGLPRLERIGIQVK